MFHLATYEDQKNIIGCGKVGKIFTCDIYISIEKYMKTLIGKMNDCSCIKPTQYVERNMVRYCSTNISK